MRGFFMHPAQALDDYRTLSEVARRFPPNRPDKPVHRQTLKRWIEQGIRTLDGGRVKLRAVRFPAGWRTTDEWVKDFLAALTADRVGGAKPAARDEARARQAASFLESSGW
jgi:hypothetical protein